MTPAFICLMCETARTIDPFTRLGIWSNRSLRVWLTIEILIILSLLLLASDISAWLNYISVPSLLLKPQRRFRHALYVGIFLMFIQSVILVGVDLLSAEVARGITIGWLFSAMIMILIGWYTMLISIIEVDLSLDLRSRTESKVADTIFCIDDEEEYQGDIKPMDRSTCLSKCRSYLTCAFIFDENSGFQKKVKYMKKSWRLAKYMMSLACLLIFDICFGVNPTPGEMDFLHLVYDLILKIMLAFMIFQRRPISDPRGYEKDIHKAYKPFSSTLFSGSRELHTHGHLERKVTEANLKMGVKDNKSPIKNLTVGAKSRNYRVVSYDDDSVTNMPLEGDIREKHEIAVPSVPFAPVRPPKEVSSMETPNRPARGFSLPSLGKTAAAEDANTSKSSASLLVPNKGRIAQPVRCGTDEIAVESPDSSVEDTSVELVYKKRIELEKLQDKVQ